MRYLKIATAWAIGCLTLAYAIVVGTPLLIAVKTLEWTLKAGLFTLDKLELAQKQAGRPGAWGLRVARKVHPDGGDKFV